MSPVEKADLLNPNQEKPDLKAENSLLLALGWRLNQLPAPLRNRFGKIDQRSAVHRNKLFLMAYSVRVEWLSSPTPLLNIGTLYESSVNCRNFLLWTSQVIFLVNSTLV